MLDTNSNNLFLPVQRSHHTPTVRTHLYSNAQTSNIQFETPSTQSHVSRDLQDIFHHTLIRPPQDSSSSAIDQKTITLNDDFGLLVGEVHALFKVIYNQGIVTQPDLQKLDRFEQRLDGLKLQLEDLVQTKVERKEAKAEINDVREAVRQIRLLARQLETYHPLSLAVGKSEANFVDHYTNSNHPGSALLATRELATMIRDFTSLSRNALDPLREKPIDDRVQELYDQELEELGDVIKDWAEHLSSQIQDEIKELARCLSTAKEEDREPLLRQVIALDRQLASVKGQIRNTKLPDPSLKPIIQDCVSDINRRQRELQKLIPEQGASDYERLEYGSEDWLSLVEKRPKEPVGWISSTLTTLGNPSQWNSTVKNIVKSVFNLGMLYDNVSQISSEVQSRSPQDTKESTAFKAEHFPKNPTAVSPQQKSDPSTSMEQAGVESNLNFVLRAPTAVQSVPIESNLRQQHETLNSTAMSLKQTYDLLVQVPPEQRPEFSGPVSQLYQEAVNLSNNAPYTQSSLERADWMQAVDDLSYAKTVLEKEMMQKAIETGNQNLLKALLDSGLDPNGKGADGIPFLKTAVILSDKAIVQLLTDAGGNLASFVDEAFEQHDIESLAGMARMGHKLSPDKLITEDFLKALESAIKNNQIEDVKNIISAMGIININNQNDQGKTLLIIAAEHNLLELVKVLISFPGLDLNKGDDNNYRSARILPLTSAIFYGNTEIVRLLAADPRIDINKGTPYTTPLLTATELGNKEIISLLLAHPQIDIKKANFWGRNAVREALDSGNLELVKLFMANSQFDLTKPLNQGGTTALHVAIGMGHQEIVDEIKRSGKDTISEDITRIKEFSHSWELKGYTKFGDIKIELEGFQHRVFAPFVSSSLNEFKRKYPASLPDEQVQTLSEAINSLISITPKQALQDFKAGKPVFVPTGFKGHAIYVVIYDSYLMIGNKGPSSLRPIEAYQIDPDQVTEEFFKKLLDCQYLDQDDTLGFERLFRQQKGYYEQRYGSDQDAHDQKGPLLQELGAKSDEMSLWLESLHHTTRKQAVGNCAWESLETAMYGLMALDSALKIIKDPANPPFEKELLAKKTYETFSKLEKFTKLQSVIQALAAIEERLLMPSTKKESMIEGANLIKSTYSKDDLKDFWDQRNVIEIKLWNILRLIKDKTEMPEMEWNIFKTKSILIP